MERWPTQLEDGSPREADALIPFLLSATAHGQPARPTWHPAAPRDPLPENVMENHSVTSRATGVKGTLWVVPFLGMLATDAATQEPGTTQRAQCTQALSKTRRARSEVDHWERESQRLRRHASDLRQAAEIAAQEREVALAEAWNDLLAEQQLIDADLSKLLDEQAALIAEKDKALQELRLGYYCSQCGRPASQIQREESETFQQHLGRVQGRAIPATQEQLDKKAREYDQKIEALANRIEAKRATRAKAGERYEAIRRAEDQEVNGARMRASASEAKSSDADARLRQARGELGQSAVEYRQAQFAEAMEWNRITWREQSEDRELQWMKEDQEELIEELRREGKELARSLRSRVGDGSGLAAMSTDEILAAREDLDRLKEIRAEVANLERAVHATDGQLVQRARARAETLASYRDLVNGEYQALNRATGSNGSPHLPVDTPVAPEETATSPPLPSGDAGPAIQTPAPLAVAYEEAGSQSYSFSNGLSEGIEKPRALPSWRDAIVEQTSALLDVDFDRFKTDVADSLIGEFLESNSFSPVKASVKAWATQLWDEASERIQSALLPETTRETTTPEEDFEQSVDDLFSSAFRDNMNPFDYETRAKWVDKAADVLQTGIDLITGGEFDR